MRDARQITAIIEREDDGFVAFSPELDIASPGKPLKKPGLSHRGPHTVLRNGLLFRGLPAISE
jgi:hypothetical protein